ncbi:MAG TPA: divalent-cation tolerance protein CutA [Alphaproteobacteria bacterium]|nr:divalent-cation tolerance protein CutA [Alphaproteobacteria bacterium]
MESISVYIVAPDAGEAERIATALVEDRLAACVNVLGAVSSIYRWQGAVERATEVALIAKSRRDLFDRLAARVRTIHSYETPAIVAWPIVAGDADYLRWIGDETGSYVRDVNSKAS